MVVKTTTRQKSSIRMYTALFVNMKNIIEKDVYRELIISLLFWTNVIK